MSFLCLFTIVCNCFYFTVCSLLKDNVFAMCGNIPHFTLNTIATYSGDYNMPFVSTGMAVNHTAANGTLNNYIIHMRPFYGTAIMDFIKYKGWRDIVYLFNGEEGNIYNSSYICCCLTFCCWTIFIHHQNYKLRVKFNRRINQNVYLCNGSMILF